jgi:hypothetical protein
MVYICHIPISDPDWGSKLLDHLRLKARLELSPPPPSNGFMIITAEGS